MRNTSSVVVIRLAFPSPIWRRWHPMSVGGKRRSIRSCDSSRTEAGLKATRCNVSGDIESTISRIKTESSSVTPVCHSVSLVYATHALDTLDLMSHEKMSALREISRLREELQRQEKDLSDLHRQWSDKDARQKEVDVESRECVCDDGAFRNSNR